MKLNSLTLFGGKTHTGDDTNEHLVQLLAQIREVYHEAGEPPYRSLASLAGTGLSAATISRIFNATTAPKWHKVEKLLTALGVPPQEVESIWRQRWDSAANKKPITAPTTTPTPAGRTCPKCSSIINDPEIHSRWHERLDRAEDLLESLDRLSKRTPPQLRPASPSQRTRSAVPPPPVTSRPGDLLPRPPRNPAQ